MKTETASVASSRHRTPDGASHRSVVRKLRHQGGATVFSIPAHFLMELGLQAGSDVEVRLIDGKLVAEPRIQPTARRRRYTLAELLEGAEQLSDLYAGTDGALDGPAIGLELG